MMKKENFLLLLLSISFGGLSAQTNTFPSSGNVGIGTIGPQSALHLSENSDSRPNGIAAPSKSILKLSRAGSSNYSYPESVEFRIGHGGPNYWGSRLDLFINGFQNQSNIPDKHAMSWLYDGSVGVGTENPRAVLDVGNFLNEGRLGTVLGRLSEGDYEGSGTYLGVRGLKTSELYGKSFALEHGFYGQVNSSIGFHRGGSITGGLMTFSTNNNTEQMRISASGNVGIGTTNPTERLSVNGKIRAQEVKVEMANWPDYVFDEGYEVGTLEKLEGYIKANKHLPELPSAKEVESNGVNLGEMNKLLLKKIEELSLHIIQINKEQQLQQIEINNLKLKLNEKR